MEKDYLGDTGKDGRTILKLILRRYSVRQWYIFRWRRKGPSSGIIV
jgi:hypothetical protein